MVQVTYENYQKQLKVTREIDAKLNRIWQDTAIHSNLQTTLDHPDFKALVGMGERIVPYLIHKGINSGFSWTIIMLLGQLTGENPVPEEHSGRLYSIIADWIIWFENSKYKDHDVYYGLVDDSS